MTPKKIIELLVRIQVEAPADFPSANLQINTRKLEVFDYATGERPQGVFIDDCEILDSRSL